MSDRITQPKSITILLQAIEAEIAGAGGKWACDRPLQTDESGRTLEDRLYDRIQEQFRRVASELVSRYPDHLSPKETLVVDQVFLNLTRRQDFKYSDRRHFVRAAAKAMRHLIADHFRRINAQKRTIDREAMSLSGDVEADLKTRSPAIIVELSDLIDSLSEESPQAMEALDLCVNGGWTQEETAGLMGLTLSQVETLIRLAKAKIRRACQEH